jgi:hypothetical protein
MFDAGNVIGQQCFTAAIVVLVLVELLAIEIIELHIAIR